MTRYQEALVALHRLERFGIRLGLDEVRACCERAGHPERVYPTIHVAGTNGKGTTAACLAALGTAHGLKTGCYTSPHVLDFRERISIDGEPIAESEVVAAWRRVSNWARHGRLTYFEATTLMAFQHFALAGVELAVIEVGLGGRLDATNVVRPEIAVVTNIARDHEGQLGQDLASIAREKAGIFKAGIPALVGEPEPEEVRRALVHAAQQAGAPIAFLADDVALSVHPRRAGDEEETRFDYRSPGLCAERLSLPLAGAHFARDAALALRAWQGAALAPVSEAMVRQALAGVQPIGRAERWMVDGVAAVFDVAHNPAAIERLLESRPEWRDRATLLVAGFLADKDWPAMLDRLEAVAGRGWLCGLGAGAERRLARPALDAWPWVAWADTVADGVTAARRAIVAGEGRRMLVTGSFHTVGEAMRCLGRAAPTRLYRPPSRAVEPVR